MYELRQPPDHFPGKDFSTPLTKGSYTGYIYETNRLLYGQTTTSEWAILPHIDYGSYEESTDEAGNTIYHDAAWNWVDVELLDESQIEALAIAKMLETDRRTQPEASVVTAPRQVEIARNNVWYICNPEDGYRLHCKEPLYAAASVKSLGVITFATVATDHQIFRYHQGDISAFVPGSMTDAANAFAIIDKPRVVVGTEPSTDYHLAKVMLFAVESDTKYPAEMLIEPAPFTDRILTKLSLNRQTIIS